MRCHLRQPSPSGPVAAATGRIASGVAHMEKRLAGCNAFIAESKESSPDVARAYHGRGDAYYSKGDYDRAAADYDRATRLKFAEPYVVQDADGKILPNASPHSPEPPKAETAVTTGPASLSMIAATS